MIFSSPTPVAREALTPLVGSACSFDDLIADIRDELRARPYELAFVAGGWHHRTQPRFADAIRASEVTPPGGGSRPADLAVLAAIAYLQPLTHGQLAEVFGIEVSRDRIARLRTADLIASGPRSPLPGAPPTYVTTPAFLALFGFASLRDLPDIEVLEDAGLRDKAALRADPLKAIGMTQDVWNSEDDEGSATEMDQVRSDESA